MTMSELHDLPAAPSAARRGMVRAYWVAQGGEFLRHHFDARYSLENRARLQLGPDLCAQRAAA